MPMIYRIVRASVHGADLEFRVYDDDSVEVLGDERAVSLRQVLLHAVVRLAKLEVSDFTHGRVGRQIADRSISPIDLSDRLAEQAARLDQLMKDLDVRHIRMLADMESLREIVARITRRGS